LLPQGTDFVFRLADKVSDLAIGKPERLGFG
jgi:hypothetical protein